MEIITEAEIIEAIDALNKLPREIFSALYKTFSAQQPFLSYLAGEGARELFAGKERIFFGQAVLEIWHIFRSLGAEPPPLEANDFSSAVKAAYASLSPEQLEKSGIEALKPAFAGCAQPEILKYVLRRAAASGSAPGVKVRTLIILKAIIDVFARAKKTGEANEIPGNPVNPN